ncbi:MAG TPA: class I SAM-dependent methyltransferase [Deltaproteobacteria bacterium]|nr:class I SAM-dependent methyltransferase [Deltaproteobacteria bacterium]HPR54398.1 class I SAM-dependent methyltransferase [Deltaproteobacteria bacterium]HXK46273.1 class I SAM-dependent methyltransferase [Deltaproteobacteria bacterium]
MTAYPPVSILSRYFDITAMLSGQKPDITEREYAMGDRYKVIGPLYDFLATIFSFGQIDKCKCGMHERIKPDAKVLFAGVGQGIDAIEAASLGAQVTVVDLSDTMLTVFRKKIQGRYFINPIRIVHSDIFAFEEYDRFDMVYANFFLNVFPEHVVLRLEEHLSRLVRPGGHMVVGDFSLPAGGFTARLVQNVYWYIADIIFYIMAKNALHPVYPYQEHLKRLGLEIEEVKRFRFLFDDRYYSILARKK